MPTPTALVSCTPKLPFTDGSFSEAHAQREFVHCQYGEHFTVGFAAHGRHWHYLFANNEGRTLNTKTGKVTRFGPTDSDWTGAVAKVAASNA